MDIILIDDSSVTITPLKGFKPRKLRDRKKKDGTPYIVPKVEAPVKIAEQS